MNVTFCCSHCEKTTRRELVDDTLDVSCRYCSERVVISTGAVVDGKVSRCVVCPSDELFVRKDFSQRWGVGIILLGFVISFVALAMRRHMVAFGILGMTAVIDAILYCYTGNVLTCYRCHSEYRDLQTMELHPRFDLEVHERFRQQAARLEQAQQTSEQPRIND